jgi:hypothetical protein
MMFGVLSFARTNAYKQRTGRSPWHIHPVVWGVASVFVAVFGTLLSIIACHPYRSRASAGPPAHEVAAYSARSGLGATRRVASATPAAPAPAWLPDPTGKHELRYFDGSGWTEHVSSAGTISVDGL